MPRGPLLAGVLGLLVGVALGHSLARIQPVPPAAKAPHQPSPPGSTGRSHTEAHPPVVENSTAREVGTRRLAEQAREIERQLAATPGDPHLMVALGNLYFDGGRWSDARNWYEQSLAVRPDDPDVLTDLAVVYRNLKQPETSLELLERAIRVAPDHWQAWYNTTAVLGLDLGRSDEATRALERLKGIAATEPAVPDLAPLEAQLDRRGGG